MDYIIFINSDIPGLVIWKRIYPEQKPPPQSSTNQKPKTIFYIVSGAEISGEAVGRPGRRVRVSECDWRPRRRAWRPRAVRPARVRGHGHAAVGQPGRSRGVRRR